MKIRTILIVLAGLIAIKLLLNLTWKITYPENVIYNLSSIQLNDSIQLTGGQVFIGENIKGAIEAIILPNQYYYNNTQQEVEYVYMRFHPQWFKENLSSLLTKHTSVVNNDLYEKVRRIHEDNFRNYSHVNAYPIITEDYTPINIKLKRQEKKSNLVYQVN